MTSGLVDTPPKPSAPPRGRRWLRRLAVGAGTAVLLVTAAGVGVVLRLTGNVRHIDVSGELGVTRPPKVAAAAMNVLIVGSDQRDGKNARYGHRISGERTDTIMLAHLSSRRDGAVVISFPRDSVVRLPACRPREGHPGQQQHIGMINESFNNGGIACVWKTVESLTGIRVDHFVKVDFAGFKNMVDAIGGVEVCLPRRIDDSKAMLHLPAGRRTLDGEQALGYVRARYSLGDGSDIGRIQRQQMFIASMLKKVMSGDTLSDPARLIGFLDAGTRAVTTDPDFTIGAMKDLAESLRGLDAGRIRFITTPWRYSLTQPGRVEWEQPAADRLFRLVARDGRLHDVRDGRTRVPPSKVALELRNGTFRPGLGTEVAAALEQRGYHVARVGDTRRKPYRRSMILYGPDGETRVPTLARDVREAAPRAMPRARTARLVLVVGDDWRGLKPPDPADDEALKGIDATHDTCAAT
ncbi:LCP family protein [Nonomuraea sp. MCN248]|uniref:LCP family protein n=1 Tax=Nonomuraea corallina TaxID=2989783 RepID=A0ABT4S4U0_9ACTN|nr:LCP family protein [Nonomuraea corallina]MDA0632194.1 LCP family protein [Nonomuraea corallina]